MGELRDLLRDRAASVTPSPDWHASVVRRVRGRHLRRRIGAGIVASVLSIGGVAIGLRAFQSDRRAVPANEPAATFEYTVPSESMLPTFRVGEVVEVDRNARTPGRGAVIVFTDPNAASAPPADDDCSSSAETCFLKRVIALPGETVEIRDGFVFINGERLSEPYALRDESYFGPITVEPHTYFVMGDNRSNSSDSRNLLGAIPKEAIAGTVVDEP